MIEGAGGWQDGVRLEADVCVVGSGAAGLALVDALHGQGLRIVVLESGGLRRPPEPDDLSRGDSVGLPHEGLEDGRVRALGGTTKIWAGQCIPLDPSDFDVRPWVPHSGWPIGHLELEPWMRRAEGFFGIPGATYDERNYAPFGISPLDLAPDGLRCAFTVMLPRPDLGRRLRSRLEHARDVRVLLDATATEVRTSANGALVEHVGFRGPGGRSGRVHARAYVLCAGGVENARLLLDSDAVEGAGVGNRRGLVGRFFQEHPNGMTAEIGVERTAGLQERFSLLYRRRLRFFPKIALGAERQREREVLNAVAYPVYEFGPDTALASAQAIIRAVRRGERPPELRRRLRRIAADARPLAAAAARRVTTGRSPVAAPVGIQLHTHLEQAPDPDSRVTLSAERDGLGRRRPRVDWRLSELERRTAREMTAAVGSAFARLGLGEVRAHSWLADGDDGTWTRELGDSYHHIGTTRMGTTPDRGVVDADARVHGVGNLFVAGSSVFPTSGFGNPTLTIVALALRLADHLRTTELRP